MRIKIRENLFSGSIRFMLHGRNILKNQPKHHQKSKEEILCELKRMFEYLQEHARGQDEIMADIKNLLCPLKEQSLMLHILSALASIAYRDEAGIVGVVARTPKSLPNIFVMYHG